MRLAAVDESGLLDMPAEENLVRRLNFSYWTNQSVRWLAMDAWDACAQPIDFEKLKVEKSSFISSPKMRGILLMLSVPPTNITSASPAPIFKHP